MKRLREEEEPVVLLPELWHSIWHLHRLLAYWQQWRDLLALAPPNGVGFVCQHRTQTGITVRVRRDDVVFVVRDVLALHWSTTEPGRLCALSTLTYVIDNASHWLSLMRHRPLRMPPPTHGCLKKTLLWYAPGQDCQLTTTLEHASAITRHWTDPTALILMLMLPNDAQSSDDDQQQQLTTVPVHWCIQIEALTQ